MEHVDLALNTGAVALQNGLMKLPQFLSRQGRTTPDLPCQRRVGNQTSAQHKALHRRELRLNTPGILCGENVAVVAHRYFGLLQSKAKGLQIGLALVKLPPQPGMDGQQADGIAVKNLHQPGEVVLILQSDAGFYRNLQVFPLQTLKNLVEKPIQHLRVCQHSGTLVLGHHRARGAAQIEIHLGVAQRHHIPCRPQKMLRPRRQQLGHGGRTAVNLRAHLPDLLFAEHPVGGGCQKGGEIGVHPREPGPMCRPEHRAGHPLHGGAGNVGNHQSTCRRS